MSLKEQLATDAETILSLDELAVEAIYQKNNGENYLVNCLIDSLSANNALRGNKEVEDELLAYVDIDFTPTIYEKLLIGDINYTIQKFSVDDIFTTLVLTSEKRPTGKNYGFRS